MKILFVSLLTAFCSFSSACFAEPSDTTNGISQNVLNGIGLQIPLVFGEWQSFKQNDGLSVCAPLVGFKIKNTGSDTGDILLKAQFLDEKDKSVLSTASKFIPSIPSGFSVITKLASEIGYTDYNPDECALEYAAPHLRVRVTLSASLNGREIPSTVIIDSDVPLVAWINSIENYVPLNGSGN